MSETYTPQRLVEIITDFYEFLTTLHLDPAELKYPPPEGWANINRNVDKQWKHKDVIYVMSHMPCATGPDRTVHYKSKLIDYSTEDMDEVKSQSMHRAGWHACETSEGLKRSAQYYFHLSYGYESGGRELQLNVKDGEVIEEMIRMDELEPRDIQEYFEEQKELHRSLKLISCRGYVSRDQDAHVPDRDDTIDEEEVLSQTDEWGTELDIQYLRQIYRQHGWPESFRRVEAEAAVNSHMAKCDDRRDSSWERDTHH